MNTSQALEKFNLEDQSQIKQYYEENGYVVIKSAIQEKNIQNFINAYEEIKHNPFFVYYSQSRHVGTRPELNEHGYIQESMQNASRLAFFKKFSQGIQNCIYHPNIAAALQVITGEAIHVSWQNMFFDQSTGTVEHQDSWYLDTEPAGNLVGVWVALEDISPECGPFFVVPQSHKIGLLDRKDYPNHNDFVDIVKKKMSELGNNKKAMTIDKGDIIIWHPYLIHGALNCQNSNLSRKSFTSHYYPLKYTAKDTEKDKAFSIYNHQSPRETQEKNIKSAFKYSDYMYNLMVAGLFIKDYVLSVKTRMSMRRSDYE